MILPQDGETETSTRSEEATLGLEIERAGEIPEPEQVPATYRIPNFGHAALFVSFAGLVLLLSQIILLLLGKSPTSTEAGAILIQHPKLQLAAMGATYTATLLASWFCFPALWHRSFLDGVRWHWSTARRQAGKLIGFGLLLGAVVALVTRFIAQPKTLPIDDFFTTPADAWIITFFGAIVAPVFEEICFRGFLLPAFAIAYDWISLPRTPAARTYWHKTTTISPGGWIFSAVLSSVLFALLHAQQLAHLWSAIVVLFTVSLVLTFVRVKTQSVAASALVHGAYNSFVFLTVLIATGGYRHLDRITQ